MAEDVPGPEELVPAEQFAGGIGQRVVRNYVVSALRLVVGQLFGVVAFVVLARRLDTEEYALYGGFSIVVLAGFHLFADPLTTVLARREELTVRLVDATTTALLAALLVVAALVAAVGAVVGWPVALVAGVAVYFLGSAFAYPSVAMMWRHVRIAQQGLLDLAERTAFQACAVVLVVSGLDVEHSIGYALVAAALVFVVLGRLLYPWRPRLVRPGAARGVVREAVHPFTALLAITLVEMFAIPAVALVAGKHEAGLYAWAASIVTVPIGFVVTASIGLQPAFARMDAGDDRGVALALAQSLRIVGILSVLACTLVAVAIPLAVPLFMPDRWLDAIDVLWVLLAGAALHGATNTVVSLLNARGSLARIARWQIGAYVSGFVAMLVLGVAFGAVGAAGGYLLSRVFLAVPLAGYVRGEYGILLLRHAATALVIGAAVTALALQVERLGDPSWWIVLAGMAVATAAVAAAFAVAQRATLRSDVGTVVQLLRGSSAAT